VVSWLVYSPFGLPVKSGVQWSHVSLWSLSRLEGLPCFNLLSQHLSPPFRTSVFGEETWQKPLSPFSQNIFLQVPNGVQAQLKQSGAGTPVRNLVPPWKIAQIHQWKWKSAACVSLWPRTLMEIFSISHASRSKACSGCIYNPSSHCAPLCLMAKRLASALLIPVTILNCYLLSPLHLTSTHLLLLLCLLSGFYPELLGNRRKWVFDVTGSSVISQASQPVLSSPILALTNTNGCSAQNRIF